MADRWWSPTGNANWTDANVWATTEGGDPTGIATPTLNDDVYFSSTNVFNCTANSSHSCRSLSFNAGTGKYTGTFSASSANNVYGSLTLSSTMTLTVSTTPTFIMKATTTGWTITCDSCTGLTSIRFDGVGGEWTLQDAMTNLSQNGGTALNVLNGSFITNSQTITVALGNIDISNSNTRSVNINGSTITTPSWVATTTTNLTFTNSTGVIKCSASFYGGGLTYNELQQISTGGTIRETATFGTLTRTSTNTTTDTWTFYADVTITGTLNITGYSSIKRPLIQSDVVGTQRTLTLTGATRNYSNCDFADIRFTSGSDGTVSVVGDCGGNTGVTVDTPITVYWKYNGANYGMDYIANWWTEDNGGGGNNQVPLPQHTLRFTTNAFSAIYKTINPVAGFRVGGLNFSGVSNTPTLGTTAFDFYGSLTCGTMTITATANAMTAKGRGSYTITLVATRSRAMVIDAYNGTYTLQDAFNLGTSPTQSLLTLTRGTFDDNNNNVSLMAFVSNNSNTRVLTHGNSVLYYFSTQNASSVFWNITTSTNMTLNKGGCTIKLIVGANSDSVDFYGGGLVYNNIWNASTKASSYIRINDSNTFNDIKINAGGASDSLKGMRFGNSTTTHVTTFTALGSSGNGVIYIRNSSSTTKFDLVKDGGGVISGVDYLDIQYCAASPALTWYVGANSITDNVNNTGLIFTAAPSGSKIKTMMGIPYANIKTVNALAIANIKSAIGIVS